MPCFHPIRAFRTVDGEVVFSDFGRDTVSQLDLPCGRCTGCRLELRRQKAMRMMHEAKCHAESSFITLTYDDEHLPPSGSLVPKDMQDFLKRLRRAVEPVRIRFAGCGEYGEALRRPHYHLAIFGFAFLKDRYLFAEATGRGKHEVFRSPLLESVWPLGHSSVSDLTPASASYIAGYVHKKMVGELAAAHYGGLHPEFWRASNRPGLGAEWVRKYGKTDVWPHDRVIYKGRPVRPPRYYDQLLERHDPDRFEEVQQARSLDALRRAHDNTPERLTAKEAVAKAGLDLLKRNRV